MSLHVGLPFKQFQQMKFLTKKQCENLAKLAMLTARFDRVENPGEHLIKLLDDYEYSIVDYTNIMDSLDHYGPKAKIAILIANDKYIHLSKLATPPNDCKALGDSLTILGFAVITIRNTVATELQIILSKLTELIPEDSVCFIYYGGHGCQINELKCMFGVDCPEENMEMKHCITANDLLRTFNRCKLDYCILLMNMCSSLKREKNSLFWDAAQDVIEHELTGNILIGCFTQSSPAEYDMEHSMTPDSTIANEPSRPLKTQYVTAFCTRLRVQIDIGSVLDLVHADMKYDRPKPIKVQYGFARKYYFDVLETNSEEVLKQLTDFVEMYKAHNCTLRTS